MKTFIGKYKEKGFTLVELMVVVAIIGILSAIAVPNFKKYQAKSKTSEAKLQLSAAYTAEQSFFSDYDTYSYCLKYMGFNPANESAQRYFAIGFGSATSTCANCDTVSAANGAVIAALGCTSGHGESYFNGARKVGTIPALTTFVQGDIGNQVGVVEDDFTIGALGIIDKNFSLNTTAAAFTIESSKRIKTVRPGY